MIDVLGWCSAYLGFVALAIAAVHHVEIALHARDQAARDRQPESPWGEVESVPVHADGMTQNGARNHVG